MLYTDESPMALRSPLLQPILSTKLFIPQRPATIISRARLLDRMNQTLTCKVTNVIAPTGFGKSTLLVDWIWQVGVPAGWISLDKADNDIIRFWIYVIAALQKIKPGVGGQALTLLESSLNVSTEQLITLLVSDLKTISEEFLLVLDNFHLIEAVEVHLSIALLVERMPENMHLCIASRTELPHIIRKMVEPEPFLEVGIGDIKFTSDEISSYWHQYVGRALVPSELQQLEQRTEGWIAGIQLTALENGVQTGQGREITAITGSQHYVAEYLMEEVFQELPGEVQWFLQQTSILGRLNSSLCAAVTGRENGDLLQWLEQHQMFLIPLDNQRSWFRYHHLFGDFLQHQFKKQVPEQQYGIHRKASEWLEQHDFLGEAIDHALFAQDFERVSRLLQEHAAMFLKRRECGSVYRWMSGLPEEVRNHPSCLVIYVWTLFLLGHYDAAKMNLQQLVASITSRRNELSSYLLARLEQEAGMIFRVMELTCGNFDTLMQVMQAYEMEEVTELSKKVYRDKDLLFLDGIEMNEGNPSLLRGVWGFYGKLKQAEACYQLSIRIIEKNHVADTYLAAHTYTILSEILYEKNELDEAYRVGQIALDIARWNESVGIFIPNSLTIARIQMGNGKMEEAVHTLHEALDWLKRLDQQQSHWFGLCQAMLARCHVRSNNRDKVENWLIASQLSIEREATAFQEFENMTFLRVLIFLQQWEKAMLFAQKLVGNAEREERTSSRLEGYLLQSIIYYFLDDVNQAVRILHAALKLAEKEGYIRTLIDELPFLQELLVQYIESRKNDSTPGIQSGVSLRFVNRLLKSIGRADLAVRPFSKQDNLVLTNRELDVLQLMAQGLTNKQIAEALSLSKGTIKLHISQVYSKLMCTNRNQAVQKAKLLHLLS